MILEYLEEALGPAHYCTPMPRPFSVNKMKGKSLHNSHSYIQWRNQAMGTVMANGPRPCFTTPVFVHCELGGVNVSEGADTDNPIKAMLDIAVAMSVLPNDTRRIVKEIGASWNAELEGSRLHVWKYYNG